MILFQFHLSKYLFLPGTKNSESLSRKSMTNVQRYQYFTFDLLFDTFTCFLYYPILCICFYGSFINLCSPLQMKLITFVFYCWNLVKYIQANTLYFHILLWLLSHSMCCLVFNIQSEVIFIFLIMSVHITSWYIYATQIDLEFTIASPMMIQSRS